ncbi:MAG: hypothetical protein ACRDAM_17130, partial [Casimicrobium sp.]
MHLLNIKSVAPIAAGISVALTLICVTNAFAEARAGSALTPRVATSKDSATLSEYRTQIANGLKAGTPVVQLAG